MSNTFLQVDKSILNKGLSPIEILILAQVMEFHRTTGDCFISDDRLASQFGVSDRTISRALDSLENQKYIIRDTKNVKGGRTRHILLANSQNDA